MKLLRSMLRRLALWLLDPMMEPKPAATTPMATVEDVNFALGSMMAAMRTVMMAIVAEAETAGNITSAGLAERLEKATGSLVQHGQMNRVTADICRDLIAHVRWQQEAAAKYVRGRTFGVVSGGKSGGDAA